MASIVGICNIALGRAGITDQIANIDTEQSVPALWCKTHYQDCLDRVLRDFPWGFATKTENLSQIDEGVYLYPSDCLNVVSVDGKNDFHIEMTGVGTNQRKIIRTSGSEVKYVARVNDPNLFDSLFISTLAWLMASELSLSVCGNNTQRAQYAYQQYELSKSSAQRASIMEGGEKPFNNDEFLKARD